MYCVAVVFKNSFNQKWGPRGLSSTARTAPGQNSVTLALFLARKRPDLGLGLDSAEPLPTFYRASAWHSCAEHDTDPSVRPSVRPSHDDVQRLNRSSGSWWPIESDV